MQRKRLWVLACTLLLSGALLYLLFSLPALAEIDRRTHTTVSDFSVGGFYLTGLTRQDDGEISLLSIGLAAEWSSPPITGLPPVYGHAMVEREGYVYVIGGKLAGNVLTNSVYVSRINTQTHSLEPFTTTTPLPNWAWPEGVYGHSAVVVGDFLYVIGGAEIDDEPYSWVLSTTFNENGGLGAWGAALDLPGPRSLAPSVEMNGYIYVLGGQYADGWVTDTVLYARPAITGDITDWFVADAPLPVAVHSPMALVHKLGDYPGRLYVVGGFDMFEGRPREDVYFSEPSPSTGNITAGGWITTTILDQPVLKGAGVLVNGELVVLGGFVGSTAIDSAYASIVEIESGQLITYGEPAKAWYQSKAMTAGRYWHTAIVGPDQHIYVLGGSDGSGHPIVDGLLNVGALTGDASVHGYASSGWYAGPPIDLGRNIKPLFFEWNSHLPSSDVTMTIHYRTRSLQTGVWGGWSRPFWPTATVGIFSTTVPFSQTALQFQYRATLSTTRPLSYTPVLRAFKLEYDVVKPPQFFKLANPPSGWDVLQGQKITYTIVFSNNNKLSAINNIVVVDTLPDTLRYLETLSYTPGTVQVTYDDSSRELRCVVGALQPGAGGQVSFLAEVSPTAPLGELSNLVAFRSFEVDANAGTTHYVSELRPPQVVKTASPPSGGTVQAGGVISYLLTYSNPNNLILDTLSISDALPLSTTLVPGSCQPASCVTQTIGDRQVVFWSASALAPLSEGRAGFEVTVSPSTLSGTLIVNRGYAAACVADGGVCTPVSASEPVTHTVTEVGQPVLYKLAEPPSGAAVAPGSSITYTLQYTNSDLVSALENVSVSDPLPPEVEFVEGSCSPPTCTLTGGVLAWAVGTLDPGGSGQLQFAARVRELVPDGTVFQNEASLSSSLGGSQSNAVTHRVVVPYDLLITKSDGVIKAEEGDTLMYTIVYTHLVPSGAVTLTNVVITDDLLLNPSAPPAWAWFLPAPAGWQAGGSPDQLVYPAGTLGPNQSGSITVAVRVSDTLPDDAVIGLGNRVTVGDDGAHGREMNPENNDWSDWDALRGPDLVLDMNSLNMPAHYYKGQVAQFGFDIVNLGVSTAASREGAQGSWIAVELYTKAAGFSPGGSPLNPHDHAGGWRCASGAAACGPEDMLNLEFVSGDELGVIAEVGAARSVSIDAVFTQTGVYSLYAQVDVGFSWVSDPEWGRVEETSEENNIVFLGTVVVEPPGPGANRVYLPVVLNRVPFYGKAFLPIVLRASA